MFYSKSCNLNWKLLLTEILVITILAVLGAFCVFSMLPITVAIIVSILNILSFWFLRKHLSPAQHFLGFFTLWCFLSIIIYNLILTYGRSGFDWFLDWG